MRRIVIPTVLVLGLAVAACGGDGGDTTTSAVDTTAAADRPGSSAAADTPAGTDVEVEGEITVFAAASLTDAFTELGTAFEAAHPGSTIGFSFDGSSALVQQLVEGAPADVFASADIANMTKVTEAGLEGAEPVTFATNDLAIIVEPGNPLDITNVADLSDPELVVLTCAVEVPCGAYAEEVFANAGVDVTPDSYEQNVRGVAAKVVDGEADAGVVYVTDVVAAGDGAELVEIPADVNVVAEYEIAPLAATDSADVSAAFVDFVTGPDGQTILSDYGFGAP